MQITCTFNDFKEICKDSSNLKYGGKVVFVVTQGVGVTACSSFNTSRLGVSFVLSNTPSKNSFLAEYPDAIQVDALIS